MQGLEGSPAQTCHFTDKNTEAQSREGISSRSTKNPEHSVLEQDLGLGHPGGASLY